MSIKDQLKNTFTSYWEYLTLRTACQLDIYDNIERGCNDIELLCKKLYLDKKALTSLIQALIDNGTIDEIKGILSLTKKGEILTDNSSQSLKQACILWGGEHLSAWQNLTSTLVSGRSSFEEIYNISYFDYLNKDSEKLRNYQLAMAEYARDDYKNIVDYIDFSKFNTIADVGGSTGQLLKTVINEYPLKKYLLVDLPQVIDLVSFSSPNLQLISSDFFKPLPFKADAIILSRILHDWDDDKSIQILKNCVNALNSKGNIFIIEIMQDKIQANLLSLNMMLLTNSFERTFKQYTDLIEKVGLEIRTTAKLNNLQTILRVQCK